MAADREARTSPPQNSFPRKRLRLIVCGTEDAFDFVAGAVKMTGNEWNVERLPNGPSLQQENVGAFLAPCELATDPTLTQLADRTDAPIILYTTGQKRFEQGHGSNSQSIVSLSALSPQEIVSTIRTGIERWRHSRALKNSSLESNNEGRERLEFLAAVNHEVRTPLNAILGMAEMLIESPLNPDQDRFAHVIRSSGSELLRVLDQLVDLTRLRGATLRFPRSEFELTELIHSATESESVAIGKRSLGISIEVAHTLPRTVIGSPDRLHQVLSTLIACCVRQTSGGEIKISAIPHLPDGDPSIIRFCVEHAGDAIADEQLDEILRSFASSAPPISRDHGGVGIGLALAAGLIRAMGGEIWAESSTSSLCFALPLQAMRMRRDGAEIDQPLQGLRIAIASSRPNEAESLCHALEEAGAFVDITQSASETASIVEAHAQEGRTIDLVFLDEADCAQVDFGSTKHADGREGSKSSRRAAPHVIAMAFPEDIGHPAPLPPGISERILKPIRPEEAVDLAYSLILGSDEVPQPIVQAHAMRILIADDSEDNRRLLGTFLKKTPNALRFATNGQEALDAFKAEDFDLVLMDIQMPVMNGYDATKKIRVHEVENGMEPTPIVALTAFAFDEDARRSLEAGCDEHLTKPIGKQTLLDVIAKFSNPAQSFDG